jgi:predicted component of type VI protein secretion system
LQAEKQKTAELLALIQQVKERKEAEAPAPAQTKSAAAILQELQADIERVLSMRSGLDDYLTEYEQELASITNKIPLQGRIIIAMIQRQVNNI